MPTAAEIFALTIKNEPQPDPRGRQVHRTIKIWEPISFDVEILVSNTGLSRNEVMNRLMEIGIEELKRALGDDWAKFFGCADENHAHYAFSLACSDESSDGVIDGVIQ